jgi:uncharacterized RmlC-like cupin family protein
LVGSFHQEFEIYTLSGEGSIVVGEELKNTAQATPDSILPGRVSP